MKLERWIGWTIPLMIAGHAIAQRTSVSLTRQAKVEHGAQMPNTCEIGNLFLKTTDGNAAVLYHCTMTDTWTEVLPPYSAGSGISISGESIGVEDAVVPTYMAGAGAPTMDCMPGRDFYVDTAGLGLYFCQAQGQWQQVSVPGHTHSADAITSGVLGAAQLPATVVYGGQANLFTAGLRQSMSHDAANAGLRLIPASGDPASPLDGDLWYNSTTGKFRRKQSGLVGDWDAAAGGGVSTSQANSYTAGLRQSMSHDVTNAGLRLIPATGDPASPLDGDLWYNSTTGKFRRKQSGSVGDWDAAAGGGVSTSQANSYTAGLRQSMGHDAANAGLRLIPATGDPASPLDGDLWYNSTTGKFRRKQSGSVGDWDGVATSQANAYTAGLRQSMGHDAANAGLRLIPATGDPASPLDGDLWYNSTTGKFRRRQNGSIGDWDATAQANSYTAGLRQSMSHDVTNAGLRLIPATGDPASPLDGDLWYNSTTGKFRRKQSGSVGDWDGVSTSQANAYTAGLRQSMSHDATNAGLRLIPASGDPVSPLDGDLWYNSSTGKFRRRQNGTTVDWDATGGGASVTAGCGISVNGSSVSWNPAQVSNCVGTWEEFLTENSSSTGWGSVWQWGTSGATGTWTKGGGDPAIYDATTAKHPGVARLTAPSTANPSIAFGQDYHWGSRGYLVGALEWTVALIFYTNDVTQGKFSFGFRRDNVYPFSGNAGVFVQYDPSGGAQPTANLCVSGACTTVAFGAGISAGWQSIVIQRQSTGLSSPRISMTLNGVTKTFCASGCDASDSNAPNNENWLHFDAGVNGSATASYWEVDAIALFLQNLAR